MDYLRRSFRIVFIFITSLQIPALNSHAQDYKKIPEPEMALGIKIVTRQIVYGKNDLYITDPGSISLQPVLRYDSPLKIGDNRYIDLACQAGFLFCKAKVFDTAYTDPNTNVYIREHSKNPTYLPVYFGVYNMSKISLGAELFYWKGLGTRDMWGIKFLSVGYNGSQLRFNVAGELYAQVKNGKNSGIVLSFDLFCKLIRDR